MSHQFLFDVLGLGCAAVDDVIHVEAYPPADAKVPVLFYQRNIGGLTSVALATVARLGGKAAYASVLGDDEHSEAVLTVLRQEGVDLTHMIRQADARPVRCVIVIARDKETRNIFYNTSDVVGADPNLPPAEIIRRSRVLFVDTYGTEGMIRAASIAREADIPVVADFEQDNSPHFTKLLALVDHLIIGRDFAMKITGERHVPSAAQKLWTSARKAVVITCGTEGAWYISDSNTARPVVHHQPAFAIKAVDTTGCGDVFHGAYAVTLARGRDITERIRIASAAAALKATRSGGHRAIPTQAEVERFLEETKRHG